MSELLDNRRYRVDKLKEMIRRLHDGEALEELTDEFREILDEVGTSELSEIETELMEDGLPQEEVQRMCGVHALLFRNSFDGGAAVPPGHPVHTFRLENAEILRIVGRYREIVEGLTFGGGAPDASSVEAWRQVHERLRLVDNHY